MSKHPVRLLIGINMLRRLICKPDGIGVKLSMINEQTDASGNKSQEKQHKDRSDGKRVQPISPFLLMFGKKIDGRRKTETATDDQVDRPNGGKEAITVG